MAQSYKRIQKQIEALQRQAEKLRQHEVEGVVERIKVAITHYGITAEQLGFNPSEGKLQRHPPNATKSATVAKYSDGQGNEWLGRGPRPHWLRDALAAGKTLEQFATGSTASKTSRSAVKPVARRKAKISYKDESGNTWSGMGPKPRWLKDALSAGAMLEQFAS